MHLQSKCVIDFDHHSKQFRDRREEILDSLRENSPIAWSESYGGFWLVTTYELICEIVRNTEVFRSERLPDGGGGITIPDSPNRPVLFPGEVDGEAHDRIRQRLNPFFSKATVATFEQYVELVMDNLLDELIERAEFDAVQDLVNELPVKVALKYVGIDTENPLDFFETCQAVRLQPTSEESAETSAMLMSFVDRKRSADAQAEDVLTWLIQAGEDFTDEEWVGIIIGLVLGAVGNTASATSHFLSLLDEDRGLRARLIAEPEKIPAAVEELLRTRAPNFGLARTAFAEAEIGGQQIRKGDRILLAYSSGNVDEANFPNAKTFDLDRRRSPHLTFGRGAHFCLGSWLARLEIQVAIRKVLERMPNYSVDRGSAVFIDDIGLHNMWTRLPIIVNGHGPQQGSSGR